MMLLPFPLLLNAQLILVLYLLSDDLSDSLSLLPNIKFLGTWRLFELNTNFVVNTLFDWREVYPMCSREALWLHLALNNHFDLLGERNYWLLWLDTRCWSLRDHLMEN